MSVIQLLKHWLVNRGYKSPLTRFALRAHARLSGFHLVFHDSYIEILKSGRSVLLNSRDLTLVPIMLENFDNFHKTIEPARRGEQWVLDFSCPGTHRYVRSGIELTVPGIAEDDSIEAYTFKFKPLTGMTVFDVGAHAGLVTMELSRMVGPDGRVYAFEPDDVGREYLCKNLEKAGISNVTVVNMALAAYTGEAVFNMTGSMGASLADCAIYTDEKMKKTVRVITLTDFCQNEKCVPDYIKMDIEGAEVGVIRQALSFLKDNPIHFAFDSYHKLKEGGLSYVPLEAMFGSIGYRVESSRAFGEMFTWATPMAK